MNLRERPRKERVGRSDGRLGNGKRTNAGSEERAKGRCGKGIEKNYETAVFLRERK
jgi:hypothetical protein